MKKSKIWFTSDTHFGSERTLNLSKRPFKSVVEMNETIINNWNSVVDKDDIVYHLGDFGDYDYVKELNGNIILICGNYEMKDIKEYKINLGFIQHLLDLGFYDVLIDGIEFISYHSVWFGYDGKMHQLNMTHEPSKLPNVYMKNGFSLFGHIHGLQKVKRRGLNVGVDCHNYYPIDLDTVMFYKKGIEEFYDNEVFIE